MLVLAACGAAGVYARPRAPGSVQAPPVAGDVGAGEALFFSRADCAACHVVNGRGGISGADLSEAGQLAPAVVRQKIVDPSSAAAGGRGRGAAGPVTIVVRTQDGREIRGVRRNEDTFSLQIVDASGQLHLFDKLTLASVVVENRSLMPGDYAQSLSPADIDHLVAYLRTLQARDVSKTALAPQARARPATNRGKGRVGRPAAAARG